MLKNIPHSSLKVNVLLTILWLAILFYPNHTFARQNVSNLSFTNICDSLPTYFQKSIDLTNLEEYPLALYKFDNGDYLTVGTTGSDRLDTEAFIMKFDSVGNIHWAKKYGISAPRIFNTFSLDIHEVFRNVTILSDSTIMVIGFRDFVSAGGNNPAADFKRSYLMKIDYDGNVIWSKEFIHPNKERLLLSGITQIEESIYIMGRANGNNSLLTKINNNGEILNHFLWRNGDLSTVTDLLINQDNTIIVKGSNISNGGSIDIYKFSFDLELIDHKNIYSGNSFYRFFGTYHKFLKSDSILYIPVRNIEDAFQGRNRPTLLMLDSNLNVGGCKIYRDTNNLTTDVISDFYFDKSGNLNLALSKFFSYGFQGPTISTSGSITIAKTDPLGNLISNRTYDTPERDPYAFIEPAPNNGTMILGNSFGFNTQGNSLYLLRTDSTGYAGGCNEENINLVVEDFPVISEQTEIVTDTFLYTLEDFFNPTQTIYPVARDLCCDDLPDANLKYVLPAYPCGDSIGLAINICNTGQVPLSAGYPISVYAQNPRIEEVLPLGTFYLENSLPFDDCKIYDITIPGADTDQLFVVLGDDGLLTPYELPCDFPLGTIEECDYQNNFKSLLLPDTISVVGFKDDYYTPCPNFDHTLYLVAPPYLENPVWNDSIQTDSLPVFRRGIYRLSAITPCGEIFTDSIELLSPIANYQFSFLDTTVCLGETLIIQSPNDYEASRWQILAPQQLYTADCASQNISCPSLSVEFLTPGTYQISGSVTPTFLCYLYDTITVTVVSEVITTIDTTLCPGPITLENQTFTPQNDTLLSFQYPFSEFCDSTIQYQVTLPDTSYQEINLSACAGDSVLFQNTPIAAGDNQTFVNTNASGCDSTLFVSVAVLEPSPTTELFLEVCVGDSILIFGDYQQTSGIYSNNFTNINGCDSLVQIMLTELPVFQTEELTRICSGQSTLIHGQSESQAGFYEMVFTAQNGCDSLAFVELELYATATLDADITASCPDETNGEINLTITEGDGPFSFDWSDGNTTDSIRQHLVPGAYTLTLTDMYGCTSIHGYTIPTLTGDDDCAPRWYAPNAFSPNNDGRNDSFTLYSNGRMEQIELLEIFDRGGNLVYRGRNFFFDDEALGWDGLLEGQPMNPQVLVWRAVVVDMNGNRENASGDVTLIR